MGYVEKIDIARGDNSITGRIKDAIYMPNG